MNWCWVLLSNPASWEKCFQEIPKLWAICCSVIDIRPNLFQSGLKKTATSFFLLQFFVAFFKLCSQAWCHMSLCDRYHARKQSLPNSFCAPCNCTKCTWRKQWKGNWTSSRYRKFSNCAQNNVIEIILFSYWARPTVHELSGIDRWYTALVVSGTPTMIYQVPALAMKAACALRSTAWESLLPTRGKEHQVPLLLYFRLQSSVLSGKRHHDGRFTKVESTTSDSWKAATPD